MISYLPITCYFSKYNRKIIALALGVNLVITFKVNNASFLLENRFVEDKTRETKYLGGEGYRDIKKRSGNRK